MSVVKHHQHLLARQARPVQCCAVGKQNRNLGLPDSEPAKKRPQHVLRRPPCSRLAALQVHVQLSVREPLRHLVSEPAGSTDLPTPGRPAIAEMTSAEPRVMPSLTKRLSSPSSSSRPTKSLISGGS